MKHIHSLLIILLGVTFSFQVQAQAPTKSVTMTITKEANGVKTVIDTTFMVNDPTEVEDVLKQMGIEEPKENQTLEKRIVIRDIDAPVDRSSTYIEVENGEPMIGVYLSESNHWVDGKKIKTPKDGILVSGVTQGGGAETAGMKKGDVITHINGEKVSTDDEVHQAKSKYTPGDQVNIKFLRNGNPQVTQVVLKTGIDKISKVRNQSIKHTEMRAFLGVVPHTVSRERAERLNLKDARGVYISEIVEDEAAEEAGLEEGDVIIGMGNNEIHNASDLRNTLKEMESGQSLKIQYNRNGNIRSTTAVLGGRKKTFYTKTQVWGDVLPEKRALLGVHLETSCDDEGVKITRITPGGAAQAAGLEEGDRITSIAGNETPDYDKLVEQLRSQKPGNQVEIGYVRKNDERTTRATLKEKTVYNWVAKENVKTTEIDVDVILKTFPNKEEGKTLSRFINSPTLNLEGFTAYPNPNNGMFTVRFSPQDEGPVIIKVYNSNGQVVYQEQLTDFSGRYNKELDISENAKGIYFLQITQNGRGIAKRIAVQ